MVETGIKDELTRRRERGRRSQAAFRERQAKFAQALTDQNSRLRKGVKLLLDEAQGDERPEILSILRDLAVAADLNIPATLSCNKASESTNTLTDIISESFVTFDKSLLPTNSIEMPVSWDSFPTISATQYRLDCSVWLDPLHYLRVSLPPQDLLPYLGTGAETFAGLLFWSVMEHSQSGCSYHDAASIIETGLGHSTVTRDIKPTFIQTMARARIEYKKTGSISQEHAVAGEDDLGLVLCKLVEDDYRSKGKDPNQWLSCVAIERRIKRAIGGYRLNLLTLAANGQANSTLQSLLEGVLCKLYDSSVCFGDGPRWNIKVIDQLFAPLIIQALLV
ncbi:hypothetical protein FVEN_g8864 [Fusarium venenatum]|uniref:BZIP domain-containing protein n=1 Tax=Fusarium venenatum TaxID=56646 RepID=A0A2L2TLY4_9HYPO|nr:uncharacterized protein FVRRES_02119 [Fusarium venenatum]KAG8353277.1 hypothetical protein FVEN_g8864 [Fusarium venenatum]KAH7004758.1 hypothetical protein EDB82DRAFT_487806 [Fusarium venenatum]CEI65607.1 unnamed protein product [Fusarium venenatum]